MSKIILSLILIFILGLAQAQINWNGNNWAMGCDFRGNDLSNAAIPGELCGPRCGATSGCTHFTWANGVCYMKYGAVSKSDAFAAPGTFVCGVTDGSTSGQCTAPPLKKLIWSDEFNGGLNEWNAETGGGGWGNNELQFYTNNQNSIVQNGFLNIIAKKERMGSNSYTSGRLISKRSFKFGVFEARLKLPSGAGSWPAFWLLAANRPLNWPTDGEMDIMEHWACRPGIVAANIHTKKYNHLLNTNKGNSIKLNNPFNEFHTYRLDWNAQRLIFYVDNCEIFRYNNEYNTDAWPFSINSFNIILNLAVENQGCAVNDASFPNTFVVDYVRVYEAN